MTVMESANIKLLEYTLHGYTDSKCSDPISLGVSGRSVIAGAISKLSLYQAFYVCWCLFCFVFTKQTPTDTEGLVQATPNSAQI